MKNTILTVTFLLLTISGTDLHAGSTPYSRPHPATPGALTQKIVDSVSPHLYDSYIAHLQGFVTRWALHDSCEAASRWIHSTFESFGMDSVYIHDFHDRFAGNVIAEKRGKTAPEKIVILGGHYDSVSNNAYFAPGADDNGTGTACVLECARVTAPYNFDFTIRFIAFGAEEQGLAGSESYVAEAYNRGDDIVAMINVDMIGYLADGDVLDLDIVKNDESTWLRDLAFDVASRFVPGFTLVDGALPAGTFSDHVPFWDNGYDAIVFYEDTDQWSPFMHTTGDSIGPSYNSPALAVNSTRVAAALVADLAGPVSQPDNGVPAYPVVMDQNFPNPFYRSTEVRFFVAPPGQTAAVEIFDTAGRRVTPLLRGTFVSGDKTVYWDGKNAAGFDAPSGVYFYRLITDSAVLTRKMILLR
jgi:Zn-dependent M28 family amino/carboxypeptidase